MAVQLSCSFEKWIILRINITVQSNVLERPKFGAGKSKGGWEKQHKPFKQYQTRDLCVCTYTSVVLCAFPTFRLFLLLLQLNFRTWPETQFFSYSPSCCFDHNFDYLFLAWSLVTSDLPAEDILPTPPCPLLVCRACLFLGRKIACTIHFCNSGGAVEVAFPMLTHCFSFPFELSF